jgi:hypothetical protein
VNPPVGRCYWALAPFAPAPPFRLYAGRNEQPRQVTSVGPLVDAARKGMAEFVLLHPVKARPVLVISPPLEPGGDVMALRLRRLERLSDERARQRVRTHNDPGLLYLRPATFPGLPTENAAIVTTLLRLPPAALDMREELGALDADELRAVHERVARACRLRLDMLALEQAQKLIDRLRERSG